MGFWLSDGDEEPMYFSARWQPDPVAFQGECECCCDSVGWVQITKSDLDYWRASGFVTQPYLNHDWWIDGGVPYPGDDSLTHELPAKASVDPCAPNPKPIGMADQPKKAGSIDGGWFGWITDTFLMKWNFSAQACVTCLSGPEQPTIGRIDDVAVVASWHQFVVYDCVEWGFKLKWNKKKREYDVYRYGPTTGGPDYDAWRIASSITVNLGGGGP